MSLTYSRPSMISDKATCLTVLDCLFLLLALRVPPPPKKRLPPPKKKPKPPPDPALSIEKYRLKLLVSSMRASSSGLYLCISIIPGNKVREYYFIRNRLSMYSARRLDATFIRQLFDTRIGALSFLA